MDPRSSSTGLAAGPGARPRANPPEAHADAPCEGADTAERAAEAAPDSTVTDFERSVGESRSRAAVLALAFSGVTGVSATIASTLKLPTTHAVLFSLPLGMLLGLVMSIVLVLLPAHRAASRRRELTDLINDLSRPDRRAPIDSLLTFREHSELAGLARAVHHAITSTHRDRIEAAALRREMDARVDRRTRKVVADLNKLTMTDELTGLANRRGFEETLDRLFDQALASEEDLGLLAIDLDKFKSLNDTYGHGAGDRALIAAGQVLTHGLRDSDLACRVGGDELWVILYGAGPQAAMRIAERLNRLYAAHPAGAALPPGAWPTMSIGVACMNQSRAGAPEQLRRMADEALYTSKRSGRCRATLYEPPEGKAAAA